jgi:putative ABC transport system substrate-binding protein
LAEQGYIEDRNVTFEFRHSEQFDHLPTLAAELVRRQVVVIVASSNIAAAAAKSATTSIPIVFTTGGDPIGTGLVASLNRPGGNLTGVTYFATELAPKRLELLRELVPQATTIANLVNPTSPFNHLTSPVLLASARKVGQKVIVLNASTASEIEMAFAMMGQERPGGLLINNDAFFASRRNQIVALAARYEIPTVHFAPEFTAAGGLMSYSDDRSDSRRQAGIYVGRILKGEKPADLPVLQPTKFDFALNLRAAKVLGITFPQSFQLRATEVIE